MVLIEIITEWKKNVEIDLKLTPDKFHLNYDYELQESADMKITNIQHTFQVQFICITHKAKQLIHI